MLFGGVHPGRAIECMQACAPFQPGSDVIASASIAANALPKRAAQTRVNKNMICARNYINRTGVPYRDDRILFKTVKTAHRIRESFLCL